LISIFIGGTIYKLNSIYIIRNMSGKVSTITYTKVEIMRLNVYNLRKIPDDVKYNSLRKFVSDERSVNLSNVVKQPSIPTYLRNRYGDIHLGTNAITRGNFRDQPEMSRRKIYVQKNETQADQINEEIRDLLSKLSDGNKDKLLGEFMKKNIPDECGQTLINNIYSFAVDLTYLIHIYVELIFMLKKKNINLHNQLIEKIVSVATEPLIVEDQQYKRMRMGNIILISEIYTKNAGVITYQAISQIIEFLIKSIAPERPDGIQLLCELLKKIMPVLKNQSDDSFSESISQIKDIAYNRDYDKRYRFMVQDIVDLYNEED